MCLDCLMMHLIELQNSHEDPIKSVLAGDESLRRSRRVGCISF